MQTSPRKCEALSPPGLFPDNENVPRRPPLIPNTIFKRSTGSCQGSNACLGKDTKRWVRAVSAIGKYIREFNEKHKDDEHMQYRWYSDTLEEKEIQAQLYRIVDDKAKDMLDGIYGRMTYCEAQLQFGALMESFVVTVGKHPSFDPLTQTVRLFGIRSIIDSKMTTKRRGVREKSKKQNRQNAKEITLQTTRGEESSIPLAPSEYKVADLVDAEPLAALTVPDLPQEEDNIVPAIVRNIKKVEKKGAPRQMLQSETTADSRRLTKNGISQLTNKARPSCSSTEVGMVGRKSFNANSRASEPSIRQKRNNVSKKDPHKNKKAKGTPKKKAITQQSQDAAHVSVSISPSLVLPSQDNEELDISRIPTGNASNAPDEQSDIDEEIRALERLLALKRRKKQSERVNPQH